MKPGLWMYEMPFCNQDILIDISYIPSSYVPRIAL